ncbi:MAG: anti-sigma factor family protein [Lachnospiraceae bacterium]
MNCREACRAMTDFLEGTYPVSRQEEFLQHVENCADCREELAVTLTLQMALNALDDNTEFIYTDSDEGIKKVLDNAAVRVAHYNRYCQIKWTIGTVAGWALVLTCALWILYWMQTGFRLF